MQTLLVIVILLLTAPLIGSFPAMLLVVGPAIGWVVSTDKLGQSIEVFLGFAFIIAILGGLAAIVRTLLG